MPLYDRVIIAVAVATTNPIQFFTVPIGSGTGVNGSKQIWDTNMTQASRLESPRSFIVRALRVYFEGDIAVLDLLNFFKNYIVVLIVGEKTYQQAPLWFHPAGGGALINGNLSTARLASTINESAVSNGMPDPRAINVLDVPLAVKIDQNENFRVEFQGNSFTTQAAGGTVFGTGAGIRVVLDGELTRQVQ